MEAKVLESLASVNACRTAALARVGQAKRLDPPEGRAQGWLRGMAEAKRIQAAQPLPNSLLGDKAT